MSTPNPLVPQGSLLEQQAKSKSTVQVAAFIVALHVVILGGLLFLGCKKEERPQEPSLTDALISPPPVTGDPNALPADPFATPTNVQAGTVDSGLDAPPPILPPPVTTIPSVIPDPLTVPPFTAPVPSSSEYAIQKGDVAFNLAKARGLTLKQLQDANPGVDLAKLKIGQKLQIPAPSSAVEPSSSSGRTADGLAIHTVRGGENLSRIAKRYGVTVKEIRTVNGLKSNDIKVGQKLKIPSLAGASRSGTAPETPGLVPPPLVTPTRPINP